MERVCKFLKDAETYYLATVDGNRPRVRPFGTAHIFEGRLYIQTGRKKEVSRQIAANPNVEICAFKDGEWLRLSGELVEDDRREARVSMLDAYPELKAMYDPDDGNTQVFYFKNATAVFSSFTKPQTEQVNFITPSVVFVASFVTVLSPKVCSSEFSMISHPLPQTVQCSSSSCSILLDLPTQ